VRAWLDFYPYQLKFVVSAPDDVDEIETMLGELRRDIPRAKVLLMPEGASLDALRARAGWLAELCKQRGYRYAHRLQVELYGNRRRT
jgi:7-carboxy-7-deazaguanine synthase